MNSRHASSLPPAPLALPVDPFRLYSLAPSPDLVPFPGTITPGPTDIYVQTIRALVPKGTRIHPIVA